MISVIRLVCFRCLPCPGITNGAFGGLIMNGFMVESARRLLSRANAVEYCSGRATSDSLLRDRAGIA